MHKQPFASKPMMASTCCFCTHPNPLGAKFCNECASPLHLKPCRQCDAVNARDAEVCYRCTAAFPAAPKMVEASPERIVAEADATLAALRRDLDATAVPSADAAVQAVPLPAPVLEQEIARAASAGGLGGPEASHAEPTSDEAPIDETTIDETKFDETSIADNAEHPQWRPERRSRTFLVALVGGLAVLAVAVYAIRNPAQLDEWFGRTGGATVSESPAGEATPAAPSAEVPVDPRVLSTAADSAPATSSAGAATIGQSKPETSAVADNQPPPSAPTDVVAPTVAAPEPAAAAPDPPPPVAANPERQAKAAQGSRAKGSAAKARPRERSPKPRGQAPEVQNPRSSEQSTTQAARNEPCSEAVAALGLCNR